MLDHPSTTPRATSWTGPQSTTAVLAGRPWADEPTEGGGAGSVRRPLATAWSSLLSILCVLLMAAACYLVIYYFCANIIESTQPIVIYPAD